MNYLTLDEIKRQCNIDLEYTGDDEYLEMVGDAAEDMTAQLLDMPLDELEAETGDLPASIRHALRMLVDYFYSVNRGSSENTPSIPEAVFTMLKLYRNFQ